MPNFWHGLYYDYWGVQHDYTGEDARRLLHTDRYNERSLHHIGYQKVDNRWVPAYLNKDWLLLIFKRGWIWGWEWWYWWGWGCRGDTWQHYYTLKISARCWSFHWTDIYTATNPRIPPATPTTIRPSTNTSTWISLEQFTQIFDALTAWFSSIISDLRQE